MVLNFSFMSSDDSIRRLILVWSVLVEDEISAFRCFITAGDNFPNSHASVVVLLMDGILMQNNSLFCWGSPDHTLRDTVLNGLFSEHKLSTITQSLILFMTKLTCLNTISETT